jgi:hypothetical protein
MESLFCCLLKQEQALQCLSTAAHQSDMLIMLGIEQPVLQGTRAGLAVLSGMQNLRFA